MPLLMILQWAQTNGRNHKQIQSKSAANNFKCLTVNMIKSLTSFQVRLRKQRKKKKKQQRYMNDPEINKESSRVVFKTRKCMVHNEHTWESFSASPKTNEFPFSLTGPLWPRWTLSPLQCVLKVLFLKTSHFFSPCPSKPPIYAFL